MLHEGDCFVAMAQHFASKTWSSSTLLRGLELVSKQQSMDLSHVHNEREDAASLVDMEKELELLQAHCRNGLRQQPLVLNKILLYGNPAYASP